MSRPVLSAALLLAAATAPARAQDSARPAVAPPAPAPDSAAAPVAPSYTAHRVYDTRKKRFIEFETLAARLAAADLVFVGEQHDDPATHRMELAILEGIARRRDSVVLSLEMFERDVQPALDGFLRGEVAESAFLAGSRPWKNYRQDYRPLVELARVRGWPVVASNVPRPLASLVARGGLGALDTLAPARRALAAGALACPDDEYFRRFRAAMTGHGGSGGAPAPPEEQLARMYQAQCVKDETMGEAVAWAWQPGRLVVHYNGAFHSDFHLGTAARARARAPGARALVVTALPVADLDRLDPSKEDRKRADYLLFVLTPKAAALASGR